MKGLIPAFLSLLVLPAILSCRGESSKEVTASPSRPAHWATPVKGLPGLPNFYKVDEGLYRGAQPEEEGFLQLKKLGVKTVVNLRSLHSDRSECREAGLDYVKIATQAWDSEQEEVVEFLKIAMDPARRPVFVHCQHGADRTGMMCAVYRIVAMDWTREEAAREMTEGGYGFHSIWDNLKEYVMELDVEALKEAL